VQLPPGNRRGQRFHGHQVAIERFRAIAYFCRYRLEHRQGDEEMPLCRNIRAFVASLAPMGC
jgi:hypothetical protein